MKKFISTVLTILMLLSTIPASAAQADRFKDVRRSDWFYEGIMDAVENDIFSGVSENEFAPNIAMSRGMFVTALGKLEGINAKDYKNMGAFKDVPEDAYYTAYVNWAVEKGICVGIGYNLFAPNRPVTREEAMLMIYHYSDAYNIELEQIDKRQFIFTDLRTLSSISREAINAMAGALVVDGRTAYTFDPKARLTRAEAAHIMVKVHYIFNDISQRVTANTELTGNTGIFTIDLPPQWHGRVSLDYSDNHLGSDDGNYYLSVFANISNTSTELLRIDVVEENGTKYSQFYKDGKLLSEFEELNVIEIDGKSYTVFLSINDRALRILKGDNLVTFRRLWLVCDFAVDTLEYTDLVTVTKGEGSDEEKLIAEVSENDEEFGLSEESFPESEIEESTVNDEITSEESVIEYTE